MSDWFWLLLLTDLIAFMNVSSSTAPFFLFSKHELAYDDDHKLLEHYLNDSVSPCDDFYEYACGRWIANNVLPKNEPFWNQWQAAGKEIGRRLETILTMKRNVPRHVLKVQHIFKACLHGQDSNADDLRSLIDDLNGWSIITNKTNGIWTKTVGKITRLLGIHPLIKMHVFIDFKNTLGYILYVERGDLNLPHSILLDPIRYKRYIKTYLLWILETIKHLYPKRGLGVARLENQVTEMVKFEIELAKLHTLKETNEKIALSVLQKELPYFKWAEMLEELFNSTSVAVDANEKVLLRSRRYLIGLNKLLKKTKSSTLGNYIIWCVVRSLSRDTTKYMRKLNFMMDNVVFGLKEDMAKSEECIHNVNRYMEFALVPIYWKSYVTLSATRQVNEMVENIKGEFIKTMKKNTWLDSKTRNIAVEKILSMKYIIGSLDWARNASLVENNYAQLNVSSTNNLHNVLQLRSFKMRNELEKLRKSAVFELPESPFTTNAYYSILQNFIFIPLGLLQRPFFDLHRPTASNYGSLGTLIGHEMAHSLDAVGRYADKNGNIQDWWSRRDVSNYEERVDCFQNFYQDHNGNKVTMVDEYVADNVGVKISYDAFKTLNESRKTTDRLFFISFALVWCEISSGKEFIVEEEYGTAKSRVLGAMQSVDAFNVAFNCFNNSNECVLDEIISVLISSQLIAQITKPQAIYSRDATRSIIEDITQSSMMRLDPTSMDKLWDLITMVFKWQVTLSSDLLAITLRHLYEIETFTIDPDTQLQLHKVQNVIENFNKIFNVHEKHQIREDILVWLENYKIRVSLLLRMGLQDQDASFIVENVNPVARDMLKNLGENIYAITRNGNILEKDGVSSDKGIDNERVGEEEVGVEKESRELQVFVEQMLGDRKLSTSSTSDGGGHAFKLLIHDDEQRDAITLELFDHIDASIRDSALQSIFNDLNLKHADEEHDSSVRDDLLEIMANDDQIT